jgi:UDP-glucose 4-epimerase
MSKLMITGANGFLGRNATPFLKQMFDETVLIDKPPFLWDQSVREGWSHNNQIHYCDITEDIPVLKEHLKEVDVVVHMANRSRIDPSWNEYAEYYNVNITATHKFFSLCQTMGVRKFVYISSSSVYGNNGTIKQREDSQLMPTNPYAVSKMSAEWALHVQSLVGDTELIIIRPFTMYGDFMDFGKNALVIPKFISAWETNQPLLLHGGGDQRRDFVHVSDVIKGLMIVLEYGEHGDVFNLGSGQSVSIKQLADIISHRQIVVPPRVGAVANTEADITRLAELGYKPNVKVLRWLTDLMEELKLKNISNIKEA